MRKQGPRHEDISAIVPLLQSLVAIEFWRGGLSQTEIAKRLRVSKTVVNNILKGLNREVVNATER
jgi:transposase